MVLLALTTVSMNKMLHICSELSKDYNVLSNPTNSRHMVRSIYDSYPDLVLNESSSLKVIQFEHLGNTTDHNALSDSITNFIRQFQINVNILMALFGKFFFPDNRYQLFKAYCMTLYAYQIWNLSKKRGRQFLHHV